MIYSMNTASRMESTGTGGRIHVSQATYDILKRHGKENWLKERGVTVFAKGKGSLKTYWLEMGGRRSGSGPRSESGMSSHSSSYGMSDFSDREGDVFEEEATRAARLKEDKHRHRLIQWNVDVLLGLLREITAARGVQKKSSDTDMQIRTLEVESVTKDKMVFEEVAEVIALPHFDANSSVKTKSSKDVKLGQDVVHEAFGFVRSVSMLYQKNPFHNFEHASHVANSTVKLLSRIIAPDYEHAGSQQSLHDYTYGITSDPLTRFAVFFSALIHDAGHEGVPNTQLIKEAKPVAAMYKNKSVAEQNSIDLCWSLLMQDEYQNLRRAIYGESVNDFMRFRQLVVNVVLATDIMDPELKNLRNSRWDKAFSEGGVSLHGTKEGKRAVDRKATIVIEHLIQASDVAHTMQHWQYVNVSSCDF